MPEHDEQSAVAPYGCAHQIAAETLESVDDPDAPMDARERHDLEQTQQAITELIDLSVHGERMDEHVEGALIALRGLAVSTGAAFKAGHIDDRSMETFSTIFGRFMIALSGIYMTGVVSTTMLQSMLDAVPTT